MFFLLKHNPVYAEVSELLERYIDDSMVDGLSRLTGDGHVVLKRLKADILPPRVLDWFSTRSLHPQFLQLFASRPRNCGVIHKDGIDRKATLNIPIKGCSRGVAEWFSDIFTEHKVVNPTTTVRITEEELMVYPSRLDIPPTHSFVLTSPHVLDIDQWHRLNNADNDEYRYVAALRFHGNPTAQQIAEKLS